MLDVLCHSGTQVSSEIPLDQPEREVQSGGHSSGRDHVTVVNDAVVAPRRPRCDEVVPRRVMRYRWSSLQELRGRKQHASRAHRRERRTRSVKLGKSGWKIASLGLAPSATFGASAPATARNDDEIGVPVQNPVWFDLESVGRAHELGGLQGDETSREVGSHLGRLSEHLERPDSIEFVETFIDDDVYPHSTPKAAR